jgi:hypothetical protein
MTSAARLQANRDNARASTGPRSDAGKARASRNACRHGLSVPARSDPAHVAEIDHLAHKLAGSKASPEVMSRADQVADAHLEVERARRRRRQLVEQYRKQASKLERQAGPLHSINNHVLSEAGASTLSDLIAEIHAVDRYEERALSQRNRSTVALDTARILESLHRRVE